MEIHNEHHMGKRGEIKYKSMSSMVALALSMRTFLPEAMALLVYTMVSTIIGYQRRELNYKYTATALKRTHLQHLRVLAVLGELALNVVLKVAEGLLGRLTNRASQTW